ncbi:MAG: small ribosomal subunit Rsm22 family protein [Acidimicrobiales bacterium]
MSEEPGTVAAPAPFEAAIERELSEVRHQDLAGPASRLSQRYRFGEAGDERSFTPGQLHAYLATRAPATFAATRRVLSELRALRPGWAPRTVLDLGAGPGTATWAAAAVFPSLEHAELVEREPDMAALGARLAEAGAPVLLAHATWTVADASRLKDRKADLVVGAYVLGELRDGLDQPALERWWGATRGELVLVEPGTPAGFERLRAARVVLISWGARVTAPCPHDDVCPMEGSDWCHFAVRLERSSLHRALKGAKLGYEDEKYSYLAMSASPPCGPVARLVRPPRPHKGHVRLWLCEGGGLTERVISRRDGEIYKRAQKARWGDHLD